MKGQTRPSWHNTQSNGGILSTSYWSLDFHSDQLCIYHFVRKIMNHWVCYFTEKVVILLRLSGRPDLSPGHLYLCSHSLNKKYIVSCLSVGYIEEYSGWEWGQVWLVEQWDSHINTSVASSSEGKYNKKVQRKARKRKYCMERLVNALCGFQQQTSHFWVATVKENAQAPLKCAFNIIASFQDSILWILKSHFDLLLSKRTKRGFTSLVCAAFLRYCFVSTKWYQRYSY